MFWTFLIKHEKLQRQVQYHANRVICKVGTFVGFIVDSAKTSVSVKIGNGCTTLKKKKQCVKFQDPPKLVVVKVWSHVFIL